MRSLLLLLLLSTIQLIQQNAVGAPTTKSNTYTLSNCTYENLQHFSAKSTARELYIEHCHIPELKNAIFMRYTALETLEITDSNLTTLQDYALNALKQLRVLSLMRNNLTHLKSWSNEPLTALVSLDLRRNAIRGLTLNSFHRYPNLQRLNLAVNLIDDIDDGIFRWMPNLKYLNLGRNQLKVIDSRNFHGMHRLTHLSLHHNHIGKIESTSFDTNTHLRSLRLEGNELHDLSFMSVNMVQLVHLNLSHNVIESLDRLAFSKDFEIRDIDLSYNRITDVLTETFAGLESLESLNISHNAVQLIEPGSFNELSNLQLIDLSVNNLTTLPTQLFNATIKLQSVNLSVNALQQIEPQAFAGLTALHVLDLAKNKLQTDSFLQNLAFNLERSQLKLNISHNHFTMLNITTLASFESVELIGNLWSCKWVIPELMRPGSDPFKLHFERNITIATRWSNDLSRISSIDCYDGDSKRSVILLEKSSDAANVPLSSSIDLSPPPFIWPKIRLDKFDSRSVIIWLLIFIVVVFAVLRVVSLCMGQRKQKRLLQEYIDKENDMESDEKDADEPDNLKYLKARLSMKYRDSLDEIVKQKTCRTDSNSSLR